MRIASLLLLILPSLLLLSACDRDAHHEAAARTGGDPSHGQALIGLYGCSSCHTIPGIRGANALVGPPLDHIANRAYIAGVLQNTPSNMIQWIKNPPAVDPRTAMPNMHIPDPDVRDIASYLYTLK